MSTDNKNNNEDLEFEQMMQERMSNNFVASSNNNTQIDGRLKEMNKKLPSWNLEPPYSFIK